MTATNSGFFGHSQQEISRSLFYGCFLSDVKNRLTIQSAFTTLGWICKDAKVFMGHGNLYLFRGSTLCAQGSG